MSTIDIGLKKAMKASARAGTPVVAYMGRRERMGGEGSVISPTDLARNKKSQGITRKRRSIETSKTLGALVESALGRVVSENRLQLKVGLSQYVLLRAYEIEPVSD